MAKAKSKNKGTLDPYQRSIIERLHHGQISIEYVLAFLVLAIVFTRLSYVSVVFGVLSLVIMFVGSLALFVIGLVVTISCFKVRKGYEPLRTELSSTRKWIIAAWSWIPIIILIAIASNGFSDVSSLLLLFIAALCFLSTIVVTAVKIHNVWKRLTKKDRKPTRPILYSTLGTTIVLGAIFGTYTLTEAVKYEQTIVSDGSLEIDQSEVRQKGKDGEKRVVHNLVFGFPISTSLTDSTDEIIAKGTTRYQYMYCSDGSSRYFTSEQMKDSTVGFTHRSEDYCASNNQGTQAALANVPQPETQTRYVPTYTTPRSTITNCHSSYNGTSFSCYSF